MIRDLSYELVKENNLVISGELNKVTEKDVIFRSMELCTPIIPNPTNVTIDDVSVSSAPRTVTVYNPDPKVVPRVNYVVTEESWRQFNNQYKRIPNPSTPKKRPAILATLTTDTVDS